MPKKTKKSNKAKARVNRRLKGLLVLSLISRLAPVAQVVRPRSRTQWIIAGLIAVALIMSGLAVGYNTYLLSQTPAKTSLGDIPKSLTTAFHKLTNSITQLENDQVRHKSQVVSDDELRSLLATIQLQTQAGHYSAARHSIALLSTRVTKWQAELDQRTAIPTTASATEPTSSNAMGFSQDAIDIPILLYHYTPDDFERQLQILVERNYHVISLDQVAAALSSHASLPSKPVVITFDDGFANQMTAFALLQKYQMRATYYIINGGEASQWCIGASRRYDQPLSCGDAYLSWDQIRTLDASGLIDIGAHTVDHSNLASLSPELQRFEIITSKSGIEHEIGHQIKHFCYPYGSYNATTIQLVHEAGFVTATTTLPGTYQAYGQPYSLRRIRDTYNLP